MATRWRAFFLSVSMLMGAGAWGGEKLTAGDMNRIREIYVGERLPNGRTEVAIELATMRFYSNQHNYACIFVSGRIVWIKKYESRHSYVRGEVELPADGELVAYCGVVSSKGKVDPHDHAALWQAFVESPHEPFRGRVADRPKWWESNPILEKRENADPEEEPRPLSERIIRSYPRLTPEEKPEAAKLAKAPGTGPRTRFYAVWGLAISGYTHEGAEALAWVACNRDLQETTRGYAGMGLRNYSVNMPEEERTAIRGQLRKLLVEEGADTPDGVVRTLIAWGDAAAVHEVLGESLAGQSMEIEVLAALPNREAAAARLWELSKTNPGRTAENRYGWRSQVGRALVQQKDRRGIEILLSLLGERDVPGQYRNNTFQFLAMTLGESFDYPKGNYRPALEEAIPRMVAWWEEHGAAFEFR